MTIEYKTLTAPAKDWCFSFTWTSQHYNISRKVRKFTIPRTMYRDDAVQKLRDFFAPDSVTDIHLLSVKISQNVQS